MTELIIERHEKWEPVEGIATPQQLQIAAVNLGEGYSTDVNEMSRHFVASATILLVSPTFSRM